MVSIYDNVTLANFANSGTFSGTSESSTNFVPNVDGQVTGLRWYRRATGGTRVPGRLDLWDVYTASLVASTGSPPDNGAVGWQTFTLSTPVQVTAGRPMKVAMTSYNGWTAPELSSANWVDPPSDLSASSPRFSQSSGAVPVYPQAINTSAQTYGVDIVFVAGATGGTPLPSTAAIDNALAGWLSIMDGTHSDSAPLLDHATLATVDTNVATVKDEQAEWAFGLGAAAHGYYDLMRGLLQIAKDNTDALPDVVQDIADAMIDHLDSEIGTILASIDDVLSGLGAQSTDLSGTAGSAVGALSGRTGFPATGWSMAAEAGFEDAIAFAEPADAYVLTITSYQDTQPANESPAGLWLPRLGWWCVLNGSLASQRQFVDFEQMLLENQGRRMPGCAIQLRPGTLATVQAWLLA